MLLELYQTSRSLDRFQVDIGESHEWVKPLRQADVLVAGLDITGMVRRVDYVGKGDAVKIFSIQPSNHASFPQVNCGPPLWRIDLQSTAFRALRHCPVEHVAERIQLLREACQTWRP